MKSIKTIFSTLAAVATLGALTGCQNDFEQPPLIVPEATMQVNTTIADLKADNWQDATNYAFPCPRKADGSDYIIKGRVISSDATGNVYKSLYIQDETAAITFSINRNSLYNDYRIGQEIVVNVTDLYIGKYAGLEQIGGLGEYNGTPQVSFMVYEDFVDHTELNGLPSTELTYVNYGDPLPTDGSRYCIVTEIGKLPTATADVRNMMSQYVEFRNVHFAEGGKAPYATNGSSVSRDLVDDKGATIIVRNSGYATFYNEMLPSGNGTVRGLLSYYNGSWQLVLNSTADCVFESTGQKEDPYTVAKAIELQDQGVNGWVKGYIVGSVKGGVSNITSNDDIIFGADADMDNTLVIAGTPTATNYKECLVMELKQGSELRRVANLADNPSAYKKEIAVSGQFANFLGTYGVVGNNGSASEFVFESSPTGPVTPTDGAASLYCDFDQSTQISDYINQGWSNVVTAGSLSGWYVTSYQSNNYAAVSAYKGTATGGPYTEWLISPAINLDKSPAKTLQFRSQGAYGVDTSTLECYVMTSNDPSTATLTKIDPKICVPNPVGSSSVYCDWVDSGVYSLASFSGVVYIGWKYNSEKGGQNNSATYCIDDVNIGGASQSVTPPDEPTGAGSESDPYSVSYVQGTSSDETGVWVEGYIVGYVEGMTLSSGAVFGAFESGEYNNTNILLADTPDASSASQCIPVALPASSGLREVLGLKANPDALGMHLKLKGNIAKYFGARGFKECSEYVEIK